MADEWLTPFITNMLDPQGVYVENALSFQFEQSGFGSKNLLINLGSSTIYVLIYLMQMQALLVTMVISRLTKKTYSLQRTLEKGLLWNDSLRFLM